MTTPDDLATMSAVQLARRFRARECSPVEAAKACLQRIEKHNGAVTAYCLVDDETTLEAARRAEKRYVEGTPNGPLDGVPVAIKDVFYTKGWPTLKGSKTIDPDQNWEIDAPAVAALKRAGAVPLGKTTTPELGWKGVTDSALVGVTSNPWDPTKTAGGSSGGSGAALPLGMGPLALGTDAGGSIRIPASFCGTFGCKPSLGRAPMWPPSAFAPLAHVGPMTRTVEDAALLMNVLCEPDWRDVTLPPQNEDFTRGLDGGCKGWRIALSTTLGYVEVDAQVREAVERAARTFEELGAEVEEIDPGFDDPRLAFERLFYGGAANALRSFDAAQRAIMDPGLVEAAEEASHMTGLELFEGHNVRASLIEHMSEFHQTYDLLLTPTMPIVAFEAGLEVPKDWPERRWHTWSPLTYPFNLTGQPAASIPCGSSKSGLPIGLQLVAAAHRDATVLRAAHCYQQATSFPTLVDG